jgi:hypothetical protein
MGKIIRVLLANEKIEQKRIPVVRILFSTVWIDSGKKATATSIRRMTISKTVLAQSR